MVIEMNPSKLLVGKKYFTGNTYQEVLLKQEEMRYMGLDENGNPSGLKQGSDILESRVLWLSE